jgi:hypothetical protein
MKIYSWRINMRFAQKNKVAVAGMPPIKGRTMMTEGT